MICRDFYTGIAVDGTGDGVSIPSDPKLNITGELTLGMWVKLEGRHITVRSPLMAKWDGASSAPYMVRFDLDGSIAFQDADGSTLNTSAYGSDFRFSPGRWYHVAFTRSASRAATLYVNGAAIKTRVLPGVTPVGVSNPLEIGSRAGGGDSINGKYDEAFIYDRVLTPEEVFAIYDAGNYPPRPVLLMRFDEGVGQPRDYESGNNWVGTFLGNARFCPVSPCQGNIVDSGLVRSFRGDGSIRYVTATLPLNVFDGQRALSMACWVRAGSVQAATVLFAGLSNGSGSAATVGLNASGTLGAFSRSNAEASDQSAGAPTADYFRCASGQWVHMAMNSIYDAGLVELFVNGILVARSPATFSFPVYTANGSTFLSVAAAGTGANASNAFISDFMFFTGALSKEDVRAMYLGGILPKNTLQCRWKLDEPAKATVAVDYSGNGRHGTVQGVFSAIFGFLPVGPFS